MSTHDFMPWPSSVIKRKQKRRRVYYHATVSLSLRSSATTFFATGWTIVEFQAVPNFKGGLVSESSLLFLKYPKKVPKTINRNVVVYYHAIVSLSLCSSATTFFATGWNIVVFQAVQNIKGSLISERCLFFLKSHKKGAKNYLDL